MKKLLTTTLLALAAALTAGAQSRTEVYTLPSKILGVEKSCTVYLPDGYDRSGESYPVLYLLHGASGCHTDWTQKGYMRRITDETVASGMARPMIVVMPDAAGEDRNYTGRHMGYFDVPGWSYEQFFFEEFIPAVEKHYRIVGDKAHRAISGLSMGGGGTAVYALRHPEVFGSACPMSGLLDALPVFGTGSVLIPFWTPCPARATTTTHSNSPSPTTRPWRCCAKCPTTSSTACARSAGGWTAATTTSSGNATSISTRSCANGTSPCNTACATAATRGATGKPSCPTC